MTRTTEKAILTIKDSVIHSRKDTMSGMPVFKGTRVVVKNLFGLIYTQSAKTFASKRPAVTPSCLSPPNVSSRSRLSRVP